MRLATCKAHAACLLALSLASVTACGGNGASGGSTPDALDSTGGKVVDIYSSLPTRGPAAFEATSLVNGIRLALAQADGKAGPFTVQYTALDDSSGAAGWDASQTAANARKVAADSKAVYYIGEFDDNASEVSMPILNEAGIPQVSPANTYVGLTTSQTGGASNYSPTGTRTYLRIVPSDSVQAAAELEAMGQAGCAKAALVDDGEPYGAALTKLVESQKRYYGVDVVSDTALDPSAPGYRAYARAVKALRPDCFLVAGVASKAAVQVTKDIHAAVPAAKIFAPGQMCTGAWTNPRDGGVPASIDPLIECTAAIQSLAAYPGGTGFLAAYRSEYSVSNPSPYAILGYEAMKLGLSTIASLGVNGDSKSAVLGALFSTTDRRSVLGTYGFDKHGDTTLRSYGLYRVGRNGDPTFVKTLTPPRVL